MNTTRVSTKLSHINELFSLATRGIEYHAKNKINKGGREALFYLCSKVSASIGFYPTIKYSRRVLDFIIRYPSINPEWSVLFSLFNEQANLVDILTCGF